MRFDVVFLVVIFILVGFGYMFSDWLQLREQLAEAEKEIHELHSELAASQSEIQGLHQTLDKCRLENGTLQAQNEALVENGHALWEENQHLTEANIQLQTKFNAVNVGSHANNTTTACIASTDLNLLAQVGKSVTDFSKIVFFILSGVLTVAAGGWEVINRVKSRNMRAGKETDYIRLTNEERSLVIRHRRPQHYYLR